MSNYIPKIRNKKFNEKWTISHLGDVGQVSMCKRIFKDQTNSSGEIPFYKIGTFGGEADSYISFELFNNCKNKFSYPEKGNILLSASGTIGRAVEYNGEDAYFQDSNIVWLEHNHKIEDKFLKYFYRIAKWDGIEGSTINRLYNSNICNTLICYPDNKVEQLFVGNFLQSLDNLIDNESKKLQKLKDLKSAMLTKMFPKKGRKVPEIRFKGFSGEWEEQIFGKTVSIERGGSPRPIEKFITKDSNGLNWIKIGDAPKYGNYIIGTEEKIIPEGLSKTKQVHPNDLILSNSMSFGKPYILKIDGCIHDGWLLIRNDKNIYDLDFLCLLLSSDNIIKQYKSLAAGSTVNNLNKDLVSNVVICFPEIFEQKVIGKYFKDLNLLIEKEQQKLEKLTNLKQAFLSKMFV